MKLHLGINVLFLVASVMAEPLVLYEFSDGATNAGSLGAEANGVESGSVSYISDSFVTNAAQLRNAASLSIENSDLILAATDAMTFGLFFADGGATSTSTGRGRGRVLIDAEGASGNGFSIVRRRFEYELCASCSSGECCDNMAVPTRNEWHHLAMTVTDTSVSVYIDLNLYGSVTGTGILQGLAETDLTIGASSWMSGTPDDELDIARVVVYDDVLSLTEMCAWMQQGAFDASGTCQAFAVAAPNPPEDLVVIAADQQLELSWSEPAAVEDVEIEEYLVTCGDHELTTTSSAVIVDGLDNGVEYDINVATISTDGMISSFTSSVGMPQGAPEAPTSLLAEAGDNYVLLSWTSPDNDGGSPVLSYVVYVDGEAIIDSLADETYTWTGGINGQLYTFTVAATNEFGTGPESDSAFGRPTEPYDPLECDPVDCSGHGTCDDYVGECICDTSPIPYTGVGCDTMDGEPLNMVLSGNVEQFDETSFLDRLAAALGIPASRLLLVYTEAGSVHVQVLVLPAEDETTEPTATQVVEEAYGMAEQGATELLELGVEAVSTATETEVSTGLAQCEEYTDCGSCLEESTCGWCNDDGGYCIAGNTDGPAESAGTCSLWAYDSDTCPENCYQHTECDTCAEQLLCGWSLDADECVYVDESSVEEADQCSAALCPGLWIDDFCYDTCPAGDDRVFTDAEGSITLGGNDMTYVAGVQCEWLLMPSKNGVSYELYTQGVPAVETYETLTVVFSSIDLGVADELWLFNTPRSGASTEDEDAASVVAVLTYQNNGETLTFSMDTGQGTMWLFASSNRPDEYPSGFALEYEATDPSPSTSAAAIVLRAVLSFLIGCTAVAVVNYLRSRSWRSMRQRQRRVKVEFEMTPVVTSFISEEVAIQMQSDEMMCCICLGEFHAGDMLRELSCGHDFHALCIHEWIHVAPVPKCPLCNQVVDPVENRNGDNLALGQLLAPAAVVAAGASAVVGIPTDEDDDEQSDGFI